MRLTSKPGGQPGGSWPQGQITQQPDGWEDWTSMEPLEHWDDSGILADIRFSLEYFWRFRLVRAWTWLRYWLVAVILLPLLTGASIWLLFWLPIGLLQSLVLAGMVLALLATGAAYIFLRDLRALRASSLTMQCPGCHQITSGRLRGWSHWWTCSRCQYRARFTIYE